MSGVLDYAQDVVTGCRTCPNGYNTDNNTGNLPATHTLPREAIETDLLTREQYDTYQHYTIVRNPLDRWIAAYSKRCRSRADFSPEDFLATFKQFKVGLLQQEFLELGGVTTYPFSDYENSIRAIIEDIGGRIDDVPWTNHVTLDRATRAVWNSEVKAVVLEYYKSDAQLPY